MKSKIFIFTTLILVVFLFVITSCNNFLNGKNNTTININLDLSKIIKTSRNETTSNSTEYILKVFAYNAASYKPKDEIENLPLLTQTENKVDINGKVKARLDVTIGLNVIFVAKLYQGEAEEPIYTGKSEVIKIKTTNNKVHLVLTRENVDIAEIPDGFVFVKGGTVVGAKYSNNYTGVFIEGRTVTLSDFYMGKYEVTQEEYASVMKGQKVTVEGVEYTLESNPSYCTADSTNYTLFNGDVQEKRPVEGVTWYDSVWYCNALSEKEGLTKAYNIEVTKVEQASGKTGYYIYSANVTLNENANGYRLPTEAEWEYAARGGDQTKDDWNYVFSGADTAEGVSYDSSKNAGLDSVGWYCYNNLTGTTVNTDVTEHVSGKGTHQVGKKDPNRLGLYDMSGNTREWCYDRAGTITTTTPADGDASDANRVLRGGSWKGYAFPATVACRGGFYHYYRDNDLGFRVVRTVTE